VRIFAPVLPGTPLQALDDPQRLRGRVEPRPLEAERLPLPNTQRQRQDEAHAVTPRQCGGQQPPDVLYVEWLDFLLFDSGRLGQLDWIPGDVATPRGLAECRPGGAVYLVRGRTRWTECCGCGSPLRSATAAAGTSPSTDRVPTRPGRVCQQRYANNRMEADHGQLKRRLRPMRGLKTDLGARVVIAGHAFVQSVCRGHYELAVDEPIVLRVAVAFGHLVAAV